jgi:hypothetical protein
MRAVGAASRELTSATIAALRGPAINCGRWFPNVRTIFNYCAVYTCITYNSMVWLVVTS